MEKLNKATLEALEHLGDIVWDKMEPSDTRVTLAVMIARMRKEGMKWPVDKLSRWFGFVQGVLFVHGLLDILNEAERIRPLFQAARDTMSATEEKCG